MLVALLQYFTAHPAECQSASYAPQHSSEQVGRWVRTSQFAAEHPGSEISIQPRDFLPNQSRQDLRGEVIGRGLTEEHCVWEGLFCAGTWGSGGGGVRGRVQDLDEEVAVFNADHFLREKKKSSRAHSILGLADGHSLLVLLCSGTSILLMSRFRRDPPGQLGRAGSSLCVSMFSGV